jgi:NADPH-dependent F420 reductase
MGTSGHGRVGVLGGTGPAGQAVSSRLGAAGYEVTVGSRDAARGVAVVDELRARWGDRLGALTGADNATAAAQDLVVVATVWDAAVDTVRDLADLVAGKVVVVMANGMTKGRRELVPVLSPEGSVSAAVQAAVPDARVAAAFQHLPAAELGDLDHALGADVLVAADDDDARSTTMDLVEAIPGLRAFDAGSLANAIGIEALTAALITVNIRHRGTASLRLEGVTPRSPAA